MNTIPVVAAVIQRGDRFLLGMRPRHKRHGGQWEFPGGKLGPHEEAADGLSRELAEELALEVVRVGEVLWESRDPGADFVIAFYEVEVEGEARALEHERIGWFTAGELEEMPLAPADAAFVRRAAILGSNPPPRPDA
ncbi:MAG: (deoxy)nucleoside triphosphate pyrophosphohydrolase [Gemmatimonadota bacterium]